MSSGPAKENENTECRARRIPAGFRVLPGRGSTKTGRKRFRPRRHSRADIPASGVPGRMAAGVLS